MFSAIMNLVLGVDIGRVIIHGDGPDTSFLHASDSDALEAPPMAGVFEALARLTDLFERRVYLVSKCGPRIQDRSRAWLAHQRFFERTGIPAANVRFCRKRPEKAPICRELGIGFFVDDRLDCLVPMSGIVAHRYLFGAPRSPDASVVALPGWADAAHVIEPDVAAALLDPHRLSRGTPVARAR